MKINLRLGAPRLLSRPEALGCATANFAVPGSGSLAAGRPVGYVQMAVYFTGFIMTLICAAGFFHWYFANAGQINQMREDDPGGAFLAFLHAVRWTLAGMAIAGFAMAWAALTSYQIMQAPRKEGVPPRLDK